MERRTVKQAGTQEQKKRVTLWIKMPIISPGGREKTPRYHGGGMAVMTELETERAGKTPETKKTSGSDQMKASV